VREHKPFVFLQGVERGGQALWGRGQQVHAAQDGVQRQVAG
jgi:hypothetical protein